MSARTVRFICGACNGTGRSRYYENRDCDRCDGLGTIATKLTLSSGVAKHRSLLPNGEVDPTYIGDGAEPA